MKQRNTYTHELKSRVVELAKAGRSVSELAKEFKINASLIHTWRRNADFLSPLQVRSGIQGAEGGMDAAEELKRLRRQVRELEIDSNILKKIRQYSGDLNPYQTRQMIVDISTKTGASIRRISRVLGLARSSFYHAATPTPTQEADKALGDQIEAIFKDHQGRYGYRRIHLKLKELGQDCSLARVRRLMNARGLVANV